MSEDEIWRYLGVALLVLGVTIVAWLIQRKADRG